ncbi:hypothetical protein H0R92_07205 [Treponema sp. OMZ 840]|uniref:hypothetical protein n=1 Tax=Treponema sp. OMZ 840 TaxID=244313 RepID=UPI003D913B95
MYLRLLKGTLKKKKAQSLILIILLCISSVLFLTSIEIYYISTVCVKRFVEKSNIASVVMWKTHKTDDTVKLRRLGAKYDYIKSVTVQNACSLEPQSIRFGAQGKKLSESVSVFFTEYNASYNLVCPIAGNPAAEPERGKIAIPLYIAELTGTKEGDFVTISAGGAEHRFFIQYVFKDALFGSEYISTKRILVHTADLDVLLKNPRAKHNTIVNFFLENDNYLTNLLSDYSAAGFSQLFYIDKILLYQIYRSSNGIIAVVFLCASLFVGLMCFFIQKYSVITTLHDEYEQIALMRATGFSAYAVKKLYAVKYAFIGFMGCLFGYAGNRLLAALALRYLGKNIVIYNFLNILMLSFILSASIWLVFMCFTYMQMNKIKHMTPIEMKQPNKGKKTGAFVCVRLHTQNIHPCVVLALNTFIAKMKSRGKYIMALTLVFSFMLIAVNLKNTLISDGFISYSGLTVADIYTDISVQDHIRDNLIKKVNSYNEILAENKERVVLGIDFYKEVNITDAAGRSAGITALKSAASTSTFRFINGQPPSKPNEIALTSVLLQRYNKKIGDTVLLEIDGISEKYLITAVNQAYAGRTYIIARQF